MEKRRESFPKKMLLGAHTSAAGGVDKALYEAASIGANISQLFTANQRRWSSAPLSEAQILLWKKAQKETGIYDVMSHASYLINLAAPDSSNWEKSLSALREEIVRCRALDIKWINFHPGSFVGSSEEEGLEKIVLGLQTVAPDLQKILEKSSNSSPLLVLEATAGQGTQLGYRFEHLKYILDSTREHLPLGVCLDTCHLFAAGYDIRAAQGWERTINLFDKIVGLEHLSALHLNDSLKTIGKRVDRHAALGEGNIGWETFQAIVQDPRTASLPLFLETPLGKERWREEILKLKSFAQIEGAAP